MYQPLLQKFQLCNTNSFSNADSLLFMDSIYGCNLKSLLSLLINFSLQI